MPKIMVNGSWQNLEEQEYPSIYDILIAAQGKLWDEGMAIQTVVLDGYELPELDEPTLKTIPWEDQTVEVSTIPAKTHVNEEEILDQAMLYCQRLSSGLNQLAETIRLNCDSQAFAALKDGLEGIATLLDLLDYFRNKPEIADTDKSQLDLLVDQIKEAAQEMKSAQESEDFILIADMLEYEFSPAIEQLAEVFSRFRT